MAQAINSILVILVSLALLIAGSGLLGTLLAVRMTMEGFQTQFIGPILAFHSLGFVIGTRSAVGIIRRVGHIRSFAAFAAIASCSALLHPMEVNGFAWAALRMVTGFCSAGLMMVMESWINDRTSNEMRGTIMAFYMATNYLAQGAGQFTQLVSTLTVVKGAGEDVKLSPGLASAAAALQAAGENTVYFRFRQWYAELHDEVAAATGQLMNGRLTPKAWAERIQRKSDQIKQDSSVKKFQR